MDKISIRLLGTRGTFPSVETKFSKYGGDTMCMLVAYAQEQIVLDFGTGATRLDLLQEEIHQFRQW